MQIAVREALEALDKEHDGLTPELVERAAQDESSPLHGAFEWDDTKAAHSHRINQARRLIARYRVTFIAPGDVARSVRGYVSVNRPQPGGGNQRVYMKTAVVLSRDDMRDQLLADAKRDIAALQRRYSSLAEFSDLLRTAADELVVL